MASIRILPRRRWQRWLLALVAGLLSSVVVTWYAVHHFDWAGPLVANTLRSVIGAERVTALEELVYRWEDRVNRLFRSNEAPRSYWAVSSSTPVVSSATRVAALPPFRPQNPGPALKSWSAEGDGTWVPMGDPRRPGEAPYMFKTLLHPDRERSWAEVFVVAIDLRRSELFLMSGSREPAATTKEGETVARPAKIPVEAHEELLAAFNGGFMTEHGRYGMRLNGITIVEPKAGACTLALLDDGSLRLGTWEKLKELEGRMKWLRQAPNCMVEEGKVHPLLLSQMERKWGATLEGNTVIRRSALGLSADGRILYFAITNHTKASILAKAMLHVGAVTVAQMDVNWSYPKFVLYEPKEPGGPRKAVALAEGFEFSEDEFIRKRSLRDFFYLVRRSETDARAWVARHEPALAASAAPSASASALPASSASAAPSSSAAPPRSATPIGP